MPQPVYPLAPIGATLFQPVSLIRFDDVSFGYGDQRILIEANLSLEPGERVCLIGRNGAGKSSTFRLITGTQEVDAGEIVRSPDLVISELAQELPAAMDQHVRDVVRSGLVDIERLLERHRRLSEQDLGEEGLRELQDLHQLIETHGGWNLEQRVEATMTELDLPAGKRMNELSGGWRRRVVLARALVQKPDLLLLDEPTNHLDIATIKWLENVVYGYPGTVLFITHDRAFLDKLATRIVEIDRGKLSSWPGNFTDYQRRKEKALEDESTENALFDKKLAQEEAWIRQGIKARRTRNEGRVRALMAMREKRAERVSPESKARIHIEEADISGRKVIRARNVSYRYTNDEPLIDGFSTTIMRGDRVGILGNNGVGKTTLLRLLLGEIEPQSGTLKLGTNLEIGYFDQLREKLDPEKSVAENVGDGKTYIRLNGKDRHVVGYLKGFLFDAERSLTPVKALSGGERNRVILAKLFTRPANLLVLDEPTNDLDMETLDVLEDKLTEFSGTLIVVSHDRRFLDNVVTSTIVFEDGGKVKEYVGGYSDWVRQGHRLTEVENPHGTKATRRESRTEQHVDAPKKLGYREQRELDGLPEEIDALEASIAELEATLADPAFYGGDHEKVQTTAAKLTRAQTELDERMERWTELSDLADAYERYRAGQRS